MQALYLKFIFRCVLNWFGDWSNSALYQVAHEFTIKVDLERADWTKPDFFPVAVQGMYFLKIILSQLQASVFVLIKESLI